MFFAKKPSGDVRAEGTGSNSAGVFGGRAPGGVSWLFVFLGNPGAKYENTRHNAGFMAAEAFIREYGVKISRIKFRAATGACEISGQKVLLMKPQTYMNSSGEAVKQAADFYRIPPERVLVFSDDIALPVGKLRIRKKGSAGGHNGLKSIISCLGSEDFPRVKIGVGSPPREEYETLDWVLGAFSDADKKLITAAAENAAAAAGIIVTGDYEKAMSKYN